MSPTATPKVRLQKFLSDAGVASRRNAEELMLAGRVLVNDRVVDELPAFVDPQHDKIVVDGTTVRMQPPDYFLVNKPKGVVCTNSDPAGRTRAADLLPELKARLFPVGRLDAESTGLLLMTNDGELAERLTHPRYGVPRTYRAEVRGRVPSDLPATLKAGVYLSEGKAQANEVEVVHTANDCSVLMITLREGRDRQVRRMLARLGHRVLRLKRVQIGALSIRGLPVGASRRLSPKEVDALRQMVAKAEAQPPRRRKTHKRAKPAAAAPRRSAAGATRPSRPARSEKPGGGRRIIT